jgi:hypothetical protein
MHAAFAILTRPQSDSGFPGSSLERPGTPADRAEEATVEIVDFKQDDVTVVEARGRIDTASSPQFGTRLLALVDGGGKTLLVDFAHIAYISSAGVRAGA